MILKNMLSGLYYLSKYIKEGADFQLLSIIFQTKLFLARGIKHLLDSVNGA